MTFSTPLTLPAINTAFSSASWLVALPLTSVAGLAIIARSYVTGVPVVVQNGYDTTAVARAARDEAASVVSLVPTALGRLLDAAAPNQETNRYPYNP